MRTLLSQFCDEFGAVVHPLLQPLERSSESLAALNTGAPIRGLLPGMRDRTHQLRSLAAKVEEQQAYVLIFGPLKSGKSTLMNAIAASYVSEVTTMPAYPCMVFVQHASQRSYTLTRFDGSVEELHDAAALRMAMNRAHAELVDKIREVEATGADFDPATHFPAAIRRLDVRVPAEALKDSGTVIVDTPGLYSRMKFGYDRMTREFRDTATCAIFVVKTDNLFLEQVFDEFHELLELFSKIFLVVNLDTTKRDLRPDGSLVPSLESEDPIRLIEAFENLSMSTPLKQAREEGRLKIYPADLMNAASRRLSDHFGDEVTTVDKEDGRQATFDSFVSDLKEYLDSDDYLVAFLGDSLRQAENLVTGLRRLLDDDAVTDMEKRIEELRVARDSAQQRTEAVSRLRAQDWSGAFTDIQGELEAASQAEESALADKVEEQMEEAIEAWFQESSSLKGLVEGELTQVLRNLQAEIVSTQMSALRRRIHQSPAGLELPPALVKEAAACGLDLGLVGKEAVELIDGGSAIEHGEVGLQRAAIPVKKSFWDWITFRGADKVRTKLFGPKAEHRLTRTQKQKRISTVGQNFMATEAVDAGHEFMERSLTRLAQWLTQSYAHFGVKAVSERLEQITLQAQADLDHANAELNKVASLAENFRALEQVVEQAESGLGDLGERYSNTDPSMLALDLAEEVLTLEDETATEDQATTEETQEEVAVESDDEIELEVTTGETKNDA